jgi:hypothetical protein
MPQRPVARRRQKRRRNKKLAEWRKTKGQSKPASSPAPGESRPPKKD